MAALLATCAMRCVYIYIYMYMCMYIYIYMYVCMYVYMYVYMSVCVYIYGRCPIPPPDFDRRAAQAVLA